MCSSWFILVYFQGTDKFLLDKGPIIMRLIVLREKYIIRKTTQKAFPLGNLKVVAKWKWLKNQVT